MDDEIVTFCHNPPVNLKNAYVLFYIQTDKAQPTSAPTIDHFFGGGVKRTRDEMEADKHKQVKNTSWCVFPESNKKSRIEGMATAKQGVAGPSRPTPVAGPSSGAGKPLVGYADDDEIEDAGEVVASSVLKSTSPSVSPTKPSKIATTTPSKRPATPVKPPSSPATTPLTFNPAPSSGISVSTFYGTSKKKDKDKRGSLGIFGGLGSSNLHANERKEMEKQMGFSSFGGGPVKNRMKGKGA